VLYAYGFAEKAQKAISLGFEWWRISFSSCVPFALEGDYPSNSLDFFSITHPSLSWKYFSLPNCAVIFLVSIFLLMPRRNIDPIIIM
jgi:hypothetical protein